MTGTISNNRNLIVLIAAFAAVYIFWGSTYIAVKYLVMTFPPFLIAGTRFAVAGAILYVWARFTKDYERPTLKQWKTAAIVGTFLLLGGNGGLVIALQYIPSSLAALLVASEPLWIVLLSWLWLRTGRPSWKVVLGLLIGFVGVWLLIAGKDPNTELLGGYGRITGIVAVIVGAMAWAAGSIYGLKAETPKSSLLTAGMQMLAGSGSLFVVGFLRGEHTVFDPSAVSNSLVFALFYLIVFGSLIGFTAYSWLLKNARPSMVATYAYVNPVIAVILGWSIAGESMTAQMLIGAFVIVVSVMLITAQGDHEPEQPEDDDVHGSINPGGRPSPTYST